MTDTTTTRVMDRVFELEAAGDNGCAADAALLRALVAERDALRAALERIAAQSMSMHFSVADMAGTMIDIAQKALHHDR